MEPHRLVPVGRRWYLVAYDLVRHDWRSFRVDRLTGPEGTGARFRPRGLPAEDAAEFVRGSLTEPPRSYRVEALVEASAQTVRDRIGRWCTVEEVDARTCRVRMTSDTLDWPTMALGVVGADFHVLEPPELLDQLDDWAARFARARRPPADRPTTP